MENSQVFTQAAKQEIRELINLVLQEKMRLRRPVSEKSDSSSDAESENSGWEMAKSQTKGAKKNSDKNSAAGGKAGKKTYVKRAKPNMFRKMSGQQWSNRSQYPSMVMINGIGYLPK